ncbi:hypothetical protein PV08_02381 [Exophiala spinifera]|uniref:Uncharacterized protein n=1 Tax=Exophiala spinifera TaxID=91928 RepID=A0A0D2C3B2_9EURO|nr:uncharacterized protein PV08_02381 [Exophiala spinifera]KIW18094.1 hypothetical protein PV08_02381 [Exophiala spinifera]
MSVPMKTLASSQTSLVSVRREGVALDANEEVRQDEPKGFACSEHKHVRHDFFPPTQYPHEKIAIDKASFPIKGFAGLIGAALAVICSWALLVASNNTQQWQERFPTVAKVLQPSSILSAIISANGILLHLAFTEGMTIAWWLRATKTGATPSELHEAWVTSTSALGAVQSGRRFNYMALATIVVAIIPINGLVLQGALSVRPVFLNTASVNVSVPFVNDFDPSFSGSLTATGALDVISTTFSGEVYNYFAGDNKGYIVLYSNGTTDENVDYDADASPTNCKETCIFDAPGVGLYLSCDEIEDHPFNFTVDTSQPGWEELPIVKQGLPIYSTAFGWSASNPNTIQFNLTSKDTYGCSGQYYQLACSLDARHTTYNTTLHLNNSGLSGATTLSLDPDSDYSDDLYGTPIAANDELSSRKTKFGFLAKAFNDYFGSSIVVQYSNASGEPEYVLGQNGTYANAPWIIYGQDGRETSGDTVNLTAHGAQGCEVWIDWERDPLSNDRDVIMAEIRRFMFRLSYEYSNSASLTTYPPLLARAFVTQNLYQVSWWHWVASLAVTLVIVACVSLTFWGFWALTRLPTMSPLETAQAFQAAAGSSPDLAWDQATMSPPPGTHLAADGRSMLSSSGMSRPMS